MSFNGSIPFQILRYNEPMKILLLCLTALSLFAEHAATNRLFLVKTPIAWGFYNEQTLALEYQIDCGTVLESAFTDKCKATLRDLVTGKAERLDNRTRAMERIPNALLLTPAPAGIKPMKVTK